MAERSVKVTVGANLSGLIAEFQKGSKAATGFSQSIRKSLAADTEQMRILGTGLTAIGTIAGVGLGAAVSKFAEFDAAVSSVQAATHESTANMGLLRDAALEAGATTVFNATESANAIEELAKAGLSTADVLGGGLAGSLDLAAAGGLGVARAAEVASTTLQQFQLKGSDASHVADVLAAGAGKAMGSVDDLANGLKFVGPVAASMGVSLEETAGVLALFAQQGIIGEQAGTGLRGVLASLTAPSGAAAEEIKRLGITLYDSQGNFLGLQNAAGQLNTAYADMDEQSRNASLGVIFGRETVTAATALYQAGADGVSSWTRAVDDSGYAAETAALKLDNLKGDVEAFGGAVETALIKTGSAADGPLRSLTQGATAAVEAYGNLDPAVQGTNLALGAGVAAVGTAGGAFLLAAPKVIEFRNAVKDLGPGAQKASSAITSLGKAAGVAAVLVGAALAADKLANAGDRAALSLEQTTKALRGDDVDGLFQGLGQDVDSYADSLRLLTGSDLNSNMERFGSTLNGALFGGAFTDQVAQTKDQLDTVGQSLSQLVNTGDAQRAADLFEELAQKGAAEGVSRQELLDLMPAYRDALSGVSAEQESASDTAAQQAEALTGISGAAQDATFDIDAATGAISNFASATLDSRSATRDLEAAFDDASAAITENGVTLDVTTSQGRANEAALDALAEAALGSASATLAQTRSQADASAELANGRQKLIEVLGQLGITGQAAEDYADKLGLIPSNIQTTVAASTQQAQTDLDSFITRNNGRVISVRQQLITEAVAAGADRGAAGAAYRAAGGPIIGPGTGTSDSIMAFLSNGEHVITKREVDAAGGHARVMAWRQSLLAGARVPAYASGGPVSGQAVRYAAPNAQVNVNVQGASTGQQPLIGQLTIPSSGKFTSDLDEVMFRLRTRQRGGVYAR